MSYVVGVVFTITIHYFAYHYYDVVLSHIYTWGLTNYITTVVSHPSSHLMFITYW